MLFIIDLFFFCLDCVFMSKTWKLRHIVLLFAVMSVFSASTAVSLGLLSSQRVTQTTGVIAGTGIGVYKDRPCTQNLTSINWGVIYPVSSVYYHAYIRNQGNLNVTLQMTSSNWNPAGASSYLALSWNYTSGNIIKPQEVIHVMFTLTAANVQKAETFQFNINITSTG